MTGKQVQLPWGKATLEEETTIAGGASERAPELGVARLSGAGGEQLLRFFYRADGRTVRGPLTLRPPEVADEQELDEGLWRISVQADVPPSMEWLAERYLVDSLKNRLDGDLVTEPTAMALDDSAVQRYRRTVLIR